MTIAEVAQAALRRSPVRMLSRSRPARAGSLAIAVGVFLFVGCATEPSRPRIIRTGDPVIDGNAELATARPQDRVLWDYRIAAAALRTGNFAEARAKLDDAISRMGGILANDAAAKKARGLFSAERGKTFIGEPYERVMADYYRGLLYWRDGETDNARACFRSAQFIDSVAESETYQSDYVLLEYLDGLASAKLQADPAEALARAQKLAKRELPPYDPKANALFFVEWGQGPRKYAGGEHGEQLRFRVEPSQVRSAALSTAGQTVHFTAWDNLNFQAITRGGRVMDHILGNKAVFKEGADAVADVALIGAAVAAENIYDEKDRAAPRRHSRKNGRDGEGEGERKESAKPEKNHDAESAAIALGVIGVIGKIASAATAPEADTRMWDNLPQYLGFGALQLPAGEHPALLQFFDSQGKVVEGLTRRLTLTIGNSSRDTVVILSELKR
jgi:tetratricopeptide (TPR) repeat protein